LNIISQTALKVAPLNGRLNFPKCSVTWIVKGTFDLKPDGKVVESEEQSFPTGEEFYPGDDEKSGSPRYESDFAWHKPRADLLLVGACHAPGGRPAASCPATFRVGNKTKTLAVFGQRHWEKRLLGWRLTEPQPFIRMELRYENSFGGGKFNANPVGKGFEGEPNGADKLWRLPNIEEPAHLIQSPRDRPAPAGFGPLGRMWALRQGKLGTYKGAYLKTRWPWFPEDFDWGHLNAAPEDMQVEGFLRGDESLAFENLHPKHARYESQLPGIRPRCFLNRITGAKPGELRFEEVELKLDTLWIDMEAEKLVLLWRGWTPVISEDYEEEIQDVFLTTESLSQAPATADRCYRDFLALKTVAAQSFEPEAPPEPAPVEAPDPEAAAAIEAAAKKEKAELVKQFEAQAAAFNAKFGVDQMPPAIQARAKAQQAKMMEHLAERDPSKSAALEQEAQSGQLRAAMNKLGVDPDNLPPMTAKARSEQARLLKELGHEGPVTDPEMAGFMGLFSAALGKGGIDPENLEPLIAEAKKRKAEFGLDSEKIPAAEEAKAAPAVTRESVQASLDEGGSLEGADLRGLDFSDLDLQGADFTGANLAGVPFRKTKLQQANFTKANLAKADFSEADMKQANAAEADFSGAKMQRTVLKEADLTGATLVKADLTGAVLDGAVFEAAILAGACLVESSAVGTRFPSADLTEANFQKGVCLKADFSKATLNRADFQKANLTEACMLGAIGHELNLTGAVLTNLRGGGSCDFTGAKLVESQGNGSMWKTANLTGADFRHARMEEALFTSALLKQSNLSVANLRAARFNKANLTGAKLMQANLFQGNFEKADLTKADFSGSNLFEAEFLDAVLEGTVTTGANISMTKLEAK
jgi:uncharacterized protein YjbI with pentapeptide repeats